MVIGDVIMENEIIEEVKSTNTNNQVGEVTLEQFQNLSAEVVSVVDELISKYRTEDNAPGSKPIELQLNLFPMIDPARSKNER